MHWSLLIFVAILSLIHGTHEDELYLGSLAANIEKSGLMKNFDHEWRSHLDTWHMFQEKKQDNDNKTYGFPFNCNITRPDNDIDHSVDKLHPSHIDIIGAMGDSFVAGIGADADRFLKIGLQYRGLSFPIGGDGNLSTVGTLPNILREYNANIRGYSRNVGPAWFEALAALNVAIPGATANDLEDQAKELIKRIKQIPGSREKWKMISIFIGMTDLCQACEHSMSGKPSSFGRNVKNALDRLSKELRRTIVNLVALPPMFQWYRQLHDDPVCIVLHRYLCPCTLRPSTDVLAFQYNNELYELQQHYNRYDFAVVVQPFMSGRIQLPGTVINDTNRTDQSYFAPDCFHLSRRGHAIAASAMWTNLFQAIGEKENNLNLTNNELTCPNQECSYIGTWGNRKYCATTNFTLPTLPPIIANITYPHLDNYTFENFTLTPFIPHHYTVHVDNATVIVMTPIQRGFMRMLQSDDSPGSSTYSSASVAWIAFAVIISLMVIGAFLISAALWYNRQIHDQHNERTPLLTGDTERMY